MYAGVLFADLRGFTADSESAAPEEVSRVLRRFYRHAEEVLFPDAIIDKLIGDEVMALYIEEFAQRSDIADLMLEHARALLARLHHDSGGGPALAVGSDWTTARPSSATSVSGRSTTSQRSATSLTSPRA